VKSIRWEHFVLAFGLVLLGAAHAWGLFFAPPEAMMGDVGRILYVHVPTAWVGLVAYTAAFVAAIGALWTGRTGWDAGIEAFAEVGVVYNALLLFQGSVWARPTWGIWWTWDPRLTTSAVMLLLFVAVLVLRRTVDAPEQRLTVSAVATIIAWVDVPVVYFAVKWWRTLHQDFSSPETVSNTMVTPLRMAAFGMLFLGIGIAALRWRAAYVRLADQSDAPELPDAPAQLHLQPDPEV
jgi:heme exporter protein C